MMTVRDLIDRLEDLDPDAEILLAHQPSWPLQFTLAGVAAGEDVAGDVECEEHGDYNCDECADSGVVYLVEGNHPDHPYAPRAVWNVAH